MALRIRFQYPTGAQLGYSVERLGDGLFLDFADNTFKATPTTQIAALPEDSGNFLGRYKVTLGTTPVAQFADGHYAVTVHDQKASNAVVAELAANFRNGDDSPPAATRDPWSVTVPGSYAAGTAGAILGQNLDAKVSTRSTYAGGVVAGVSSPVTLAVDPWSVVIPGAYAAGTAGAILGQNLDAKVSTRSTYAGGVVAGVTAPVTVGTITDKAGYSLAASGLDAVPIEVGINARQALAPILAASAGVVAGAGTGVVVIKGGNTSVTRITATTDNAGNRSSVALTLPA